MITVPLPFESPAGRPDPYISVSSVKRDGDVRCVEKCRRRFVKRPLMFSVMVLCGDRHRAAVVDDARRL